MPRTGYSLAVGIVGESDKGRYFHNVWYLKETKGMDIVMKNRLMKASAIVLCMACMAGCGADYSEEQVFFSHEFRISKGLRSTAYDQIMSDSLSVCVFVSKSPILGNLFCD